MVDNEKKMILFLKELGINKITKNEKKALLELVEESYGFEMAKRQLELLYALNKILIKSYSKVSISNMMKINEAIDNATFNELFNVYNNISAKGLNQQESLKAFKSATEVILKNQGNANLKIQKIVSQEFNKLESIRNVLYLSMLDTTKADMLLQNCVRRSKTFLDACDVVNLSTLLQCLKSNFSIDDDELVAISSRCATIFAFSSAKKMLALEKTVNDFKDFILSGLTDSDDKVKGLLNKGFRDILLNSPSFVIENPDRIKDMIKFLSGANLGQFIHTNDLSIHNLKGSFSPAQLAKIYNESITSLKVTPQRIGQIVSNLKMVYKNTYNSNLNLDSIINGRNFSSLAQLKEADYLMGSKISEIFSLLHPFISETNMQYLLENNMSFLIADVEHVKNSLQEAILTSHNNEELKSNILHSIKNHFGMYQELNVEFSNKERLSVDTLKKVNVNDIEQEDIEAILVKLQTTDNDLENWKSKWSNDEKELRNLKLQYDLEDISNQLDYIDEMIDESWNNLDKLEEENKAILDLLLETLNKHGDIIANNKLNKKLKGIDSLLVFKASNVIAKMNTSIDKLIGEYKYQLDNLNEQLLQQLDAKESYLKTSQKLEDLEEKLSELGIDEKSYDAINEKIKELNKLFDVAQKKYSRFKKEDKTIDKMFKDLHQALHSQEERQSFDMLGRTKRHNWASYMYTWFGRILLNEGLVNPDDDTKDLINRFPLNPEDANLSYKQYRALLGPSARKITDEMYHRYSENRNFSILAYNDLLEKMEQFNIDTSQIRTIKNCIAKLSEIIDSLNADQSESNILLGKKQRYLKAKSQVDINLIEANIETLKETIKSYQTKINVQESNKIV